MEFIAERLFKDFCQPVNHIQDLGHQEAIKNELDIEELYECIYVIFGIIKNILKISHRTAYFHYARVSSNNYASILFDIKDLTRLDILNSMLADIQQLIHIGCILSRLVLQHDNHHMRRKIEFLLTYTKDILKYRLTSQIELDKAIRSIKSNNDMKTYFYMLEHMNNVYSEIYWSDIMSNLEKLIKRYMSSKARRVLNVTDFIIYAEQNNTVEAIAQFTGKDISKIMNTDEREIIFDEMIQIVQILPFYRRFCFSIKMQVSNFQWFKKLGC